MVSCDFQSPRYSKRCTSHHPPLAAGLVSDLDLRPLLARNQPEFKPRLESHKWYGRWYLRRILGKASSNPSAQGFASGRIRSGRGRQRRKSLGYVAKFQADEHHQEVLLAEGSTTGAPSSDRRSSERFQGRNG